MPPPDAIRNEPLRSSGYGNRGTGGYSGHLNSFDGNAPNAGMLSFQGTRIASLEMIGADMLGKDEQQPHASRHSLYQFGVFTGGGMRTWLVGMDQWLRDTNITYKFHPESPLARNGLCSVPGLADATFWGFDSFQGMPDTPLHLIPPGILHDAGQRDDWSTGGFNAADMIGALVGSTPRTFSGSTRGGPFRRASSRTCSVRTRAFVPLTCASSVGFTMRVLPRVPRWLAG